ncbi:hypothetical protein LTR66_014558 [Elasticomyces elasticus]|nr:hypothetical protein LTR66_014558 [Elasticomyces elasticus]
MGLRIVERLRTKYKDDGRSDAVDVNPFVRRDGMKSSDTVAAQRAEGALEDNGGQDETMGGGGFFPPGYDEEEIQPRTLVKEESGNEDAGSAAGGGFLLDSADEGDIHGEEKAAKTLNGHPFTPVSLQSTHKQETPDSDVFGNMGNNNDTKSPPAAGARADRRRGGGGQAASLLSAVDVGKDRKARAKANSGFNSATKRDPGITDLDSDEPHDHESGTDRAGPFAPTGRDLRGGPMVVVTSRREPGSKRHEGDDVEEPLLRARGR